MPGPAFAGPIDDWLAPAKTDSSMVWNAFYARYAMLMKRLALVEVRTVDDAAYLSKGKLEFPEQQDLLQSLR